MTTQVTETKTEVKEETSAKETPKETIPRNPGDTGAEVFDEPKETLEDFGGLFSDEKSHTEEELLGTVVEAKPAEKVVTEEKSPEGKEKPAEPLKPKGDEKKAEGEKKEEEKAKETEEAKVPPKGFVPQEALREARDEVKTLKQEVTKLRSDLMEKPRVEIKAPESAEDAKWKDFKVLTDEEYEDFIDEEGPVEAQKYDRKLAQFEKYQARKEQAETETSKRVEQVGTWISETVRDIEKAVPGIYDEGSEVRSTLAKFAMEQGFENEHYLEALTNPETLIIPKGSDKPYLIGPGAVGLIALLSNLHKKTSGSSVKPEDLREEIKKELEPTLRAEITKQLLAKMKGADRDSAYRSLTEIPGSEAAPDDFDKSYTEDEWAKLPKAKREELLSPR